MHTLRDPIPVHLLWDTLMCMCWGNPILMHVLNPHTCASVGGYPFLCMCWGSTHSCACFKEPPLLCMCQGTPIPMWMCWRIPIPVHMLGGPQLLCISCGTPPVCMFLGIPTEPTHMPVLEDIPVYVSGLHCFPFHKLYLHINLKSHI